MEYHKIEEKKKEDHYIPQCVIFFIIQLVN